MIDLLSFIVLSQVQASNGFAVLFLVPYTSKLEEAIAGEVPLVGSTKQFVCYAVKLGFPEELKAVRWYKDGERISVGEKYQIVGM